MIAEDGARIHRVTKELDDFGEGASDVLTRFFFEPANWVIEKRFGFSKKCSQFVPRRLIILATKMCGTEIAEFGFPNVDRTTTPRIVR